MLHTPYPNLLELDVVKPSTLLPVGLINMACEIRHLTYCHLVITALWIPSLFVLLNSVSGIKLSSEALVHS